MTCLYLIVMVPRRPLTLYICSWVFTLVIVFFFKAECIFSLFCTSDLVSHLLCTVQWSFTVAIHWTIFLFKKKKLKRKSSLFPHYFSIVLVHSNDPLAWLIQFTPCSHTSLGARQNTISRSCQQYMARDNLQAPRLLLIPANCFRVLYLPATKSSLTDCFAPHWLFRQLAKFNFRWIKNVFF